MIIDAARLYEVKHDIGETEENGVTIDTLIKDGYLDLRASESEDIRTNKVWKNSDGGYSYSGASTEE